MAAVLLCLGVVKGVTSRKTIWDDAAFKRWVEDGAKRQGMTLREVLHAAGVSRFYLKTPREGRSTNIVLNLADILDASPADLFGFGEKGERRWRRMKDRLLAGFGRSGGPDSAVLTARVIAAQLAALVYSLSNRVDTDPTRLMELVLREINKNNHQPSAMPDSEEPGGEAA
jgi:hypothetical protein